MPHFSITLSSGEREWPRFRVRMMAELQTAAGERSGFASTDEKRDGVSVLRTAECDMVRVLVYVIPESLPLERRVYVLPDFAARLCVECDGRVISDERLAINHWGGTSVERLFDRRGIIEPQA